MDQEWKFNQSVAAVVAFLHFFRRLIETNFLHVFTEQPLPLFSIPGIIFYYWFLFGYCVMYFILKPGYELIVPLDKNVNFGLGALFMFFETLNFRNHYITVDLRKPGSNVAS